jgi:hypothetical protein
VKEGWDEKGIGLDATAKNPKLSRKEERDSFKEKDKFSTTN